MQTIKEYAKNHQVSYEAVRKQIKLYSEDLKDLIVMNGKTQMLTDEAVAFLDQHREPKTTYIVESNVGALQDEISKLKQEMMNKEALWANERAELRNEIADLKIEKQTLIGEKQTLQLEDKEKLYDEKVRADKAEAELERLRAEVELNKQKKGLFARIFG